MEAAGLMHKKELRVAFETLGCRSNYADTVDIQGALVARGAVPCNFDQPSDVVVINTCTVTDGADKEVKRLIKKAKVISPDAKVVITGCLAEVGKDELLETGLVDVVIGPGRRSAVVKAILGEEVQESDVDVATKTQGDDTLVELPAKTPSGKSNKKNKWGSISIHGAMPQGVFGPGARMGEVKTRARYHLRIQEGCEEACTYCIIPQTRGGFRSRTIVEVLEDIRNLATLGYEEVVLTGTHIGGYGEDNGSSLEELLQAVYNDSAIRRVRLSSIDPDDVNEQVLDIISKENVFCNHLHICVQAFSDKLLKLMNRRYSLQYVSDLVIAIKDVFPGACIGSDLITGFPGETRDEVDSQIAFFEKHDFSYLHVFPYSERQNTPATRLSGSVESPERLRRSARWRSLSEERSKAFYLSKIGSDLEIIVEGQRGENLYGTSREFIATKSKATKDFKEVVGKKITVKAVSHEEGVLVCQ